jgi:hypothetical protein
MVPSLHVSQSSARRPTALAEHQWEINLTVRTVRKRRVRMSLASQYATAKAEMGRCRRNQYGTA